MILQLSKFLKHFQFLKIIFATFKSHGFKFQVPSCETSYLKQSVFLNVVKKGTKTVSR